jgi:acetylornithine deacetylase
MESAGYVALVEATKKHVGPVHTLADTGTLPLVADLKKAGLDVQCVGYGVEDAYHMDNEFARLSDFQQGFKVLSEIIQTLSDQNS